MNTINSTSTIQAKLLSTNPDMVTYELLEDPNLGFSNMEWFMVGESSRENFTLNLAFDPKAFTISFSSKDFLTHLQ